MDMTLKPQSIASVVWGLGPVLVRLRDFCVSHNFLCKTRCQQLRLWRIKLSALRLFLATRAGLTPQWPVWLPKGVNHLPLMAHTHMQMRRHLPELPILPKKRSYDAIAV